MPAATQDWTCETALIGAQLNSTRKECHCFLAGDIVAVYLQTSSWAFDIGGDVIDASATRKDSLMMTVPCGHQVEAMTPGERENLDPKASQVMASVLAK